MDDDQPHDSDSSALRRPWASLNYPGFRLIFFLSLFATTAQQMRQTQNLYQVYELSGSAFQLGLTGLAQGIPIFALGLFAGTLADFLDRRKLLLITILGNCLVALVQGVLVDDQHAVVGLDDEIAVVELYGRGSEEGENRRSGTRGSGDFRFEI